MVIFPAIDIMNGRPVRLLNGDFSTAEQVASDAVETARSFEEAGCQWIHMVDLDGSLQKERVNSEIFTRVARETSLMVEVGGGIRTLADIAFYAEHGISRVILGSAAVKNPRLIKEAVREFGNLISVGIDAKKGYVATEGWTEKSDLYFTELALRMEDMGIENIIFTDIGRDGTLSGPNLEQLAEINQSVSCGITASGGVTDIQDILALRDLNLYGAICGKSIYKGTLDLREAVNVCK